MSHRALPLALGIAILGLGLASAPVSAQVSETSIGLAWTAPGDDDLTGQPTRYDLRRSRTPIVTLADFQSATPVTGVPTPSVAGSLESTIAIGLTPSTTYWFALRTVDEAGNWSPLSNIVSATTAISTDTERPAEVTLALVGTTNNSVTVSWNDVGDDSLTGDASGLEVRWGTTPITEANWSNATIVAGVPAPGPPGTAHQLTVPGLDRTLDLWFAARAIDDVNQVSAINGSLGVPRLTGGMAAWNMFAPFPNPSPLGGPVNIPLEIPAAGPYDATLDIQDSAGQHVRSLVVRNASPGPYLLQWDGRNAAGRTTAPGVYRAWLRAGDVRKLVRIMRTP